jgi:hypothetical protein
MCIFVPNVTVLIAKLNDRSDVVYLHDKFISSHLSLNDLDCVNCVSELISVRDGALMLSSFSPDDVGKMISLLLSE